MVIRSLENILKRIIATLCCALPLATFADPRGSAEFERLFSDMNVTRSGWCEVAGTAPDGLVEHRSRGGKRAYEIFTETGRHVWVEVPVARALQRRYFTVVYTRSESGKVTLDVTEYQDATTWERLMGNSKILVMVYFPNLEMPPPGCKWSSRVFKK